jgi:hypothetical protein
MILFCIGTKSICHSNKKIFNYTYSWVRLRSKSSTKRNWFNKISRIRKTHNRVHFSKEKFWQ